MSEYIERPPAETLTIPWPTVRPLGVPLTAKGLREAWEAIVPGFGSGFTQSIEERCIMAALRAVYVGMHEAVDGDD